MSPRALVIGFCLAGVGCDDYPEDLPRSDACVTEGAPEDGKEAVILGTTTHHPGKRITDDDEDHARTERGGQTGHVVGQQLRDVLIGTRSAVHREDAVHRAESALTDGVVLNVDGPRRRGERVLAPQER